MQFIFINMFKYEIECITAGMQAQVIFFSETGYYLNKKEKSKKNKN